METVIVQSDIHVGIEKRPRPTMTDGVVIDNKKARRQEKGERGQGVGVL